jgi:hypothetical protein
MRVIPTALLLSVSAALISGCSHIRTLEGPPEREYFIDVEPQLAEGGEYYVDPIDSSVVWSQEGVQVKVKLWDDEMLDARFTPEYSPYTLSGVDVQGYDYTPPLWTTFEITVINRTRERVEFDPTQVVLRTDTGRKLRCRQGVGNWYDGLEYYDYSYLKWSARDGNTRYHAQLDRDPIWERSEFKREKPVRKGSRYSGFITFPPLPEETESIVLDVDNFILAFDRFEVGFGNPVEFVDLEFRFDVEHGVRSKAMASRDASE